MTDNPLLQISEVKNHAPPFDKIKEEHFMPAIEAAIAEARANIEAIKNNTDKPDFYNVIAALETSSEALGIVSSIFYNQLTANGTDTLQELAEKVGPMKSAFSNDILMDPDLFDKVKAVWMQRDDLELTPEQDTLLDDTYQSFVRNGADLNESGQKRLREISERMSVLGPVFMNNATKSAEAFEMIIDSEDDLAGLPESTKEMAKHMADEAGFAGKWLFTLDYPSVIPFLQYADSREHREAIWRAFSNRGYKDKFDNCGNLLEIIHLRNEKAKLLGFDTYADYVLERRMAKSPENVLEFLKKLKDTYYPAAKADLQDLKEFAKQRDGLDDFKPWDASYYTEKLKEHLFEFSSEELRPYFPLEKVLAGMFMHFTKLFGLHFKAAGHDYPVWHKDVQAFDVIEDGTNRFIGTLYADFFPRKGKKQGAWKTAYRNQGLFNGKVERPIIAIVCNFNKPTGDKPALLTFNEVTTLFHEMGHATHALLSEVTYPGLAGTSVKWDFVELPSQVQENWCFERETLDLISGHYETGEKIPEVLINKLLKAKNYMSGWQGLRQVNFGLLDMAWHMTDPDSITSVEDFEDQNTKDTSLFPRLGGPFSTSFTHLFGGGYAAGYYSYKWAEVLDADAFEMFVEKGLYNKEAADAYKREVLSRGGTEDPNLLYERFRGRAADPEALIRREGLLDKQKAA